MTEKYMDEVMGVDYDYFRCGGCNKRKSIEIMIFDGMGGRFCSKECMKRGNKSLTSYNVKS